jgi:hypothetical protein
LSLKLQIHFSYQDLFRSFNQAFHRNTVEILIWFWSFSALFLQLHYYCMRGIIKGIRSFWHSLVLFWFCLLCQGFCLIQILMYNGYKHVCFLHFFYLGDLHNSLEFTDVKNTNSDTSPPPQYNKFNIWIQCTQYSMFTYIFEIRTNFHFSSLIYFSSYYFTAMSDK